MPSEQKRVSDDDVKNLSEMKLKIKAFLEANIRRNAHMIIVSKQDNNSHNGARNDTSSLLHLFPLFLSIHALSLGETVLRMNF